jgi:hypothetical protein
MAFTSRVRPTGPVGRPGLVPLPSPGPQPGGGMKPPMGRGGGSSAPIGRPGLVPLPSPGPQPIGGGGMKPPVSSMPPAVPGSIRPYKKGGLVKSSSTPRGWGSARKPGGKK